jgi:hypothetical protein
LPVSSCLAMLVTFVRIKNAVPLPTYISCNTDQQVPFRI